MIKNRIENEPATRLGAKAPGARAAAKALVVFLCCLAALAVVGCATRPFVVKPDDPLYGTWISTAVDEGKERGFAKISLFADGRRLFYYHIAEPEPAYEGTYVLEEAWIDRQGNRWYKAKGAFWPKAGGAKTEEFKLYRIDPKGTVLESSSAGYGYPSTVEPLTSPFYGIWYQQK